AIIRRTRRDSRCMKSIHLRLRGREEAEMRAIADACSFAVDRCLDPELGIDAPIRNRTRVLHDATAAEGCKQGVVEARRTIEIACPDGDMREDGWIGVRHGCCSSVEPPELAVVPALAPAVRATMISQVMTP